MDEKTAKDNPDLMKDDSISGSDPASTTAHGLKAESMLLSTLATTPEADDPKDYLEAPFRYSVADSESVSLNNGALLHTVTDFTLPGRNGFDLVITRRYSSDDANLRDMTPSYTDLGQLITSSRNNSHNVKTYGLGYGWRFMLPAIEVVSESEQDQRVTYNSFLHLQDGRTLKIGSSGFSDHPLKDVTLKRESGTLNHPWRSDVQMTYSITVSHKDGSADYFKKVSSGWYDLVGRTDRFGNAICFAMTTYGGMTVTDSWGRDVVLAKDEAEKTMTWTLPDGATLKYHFSGADSARKLDRVVDQAGRVTRYGYHSEDTWKATAQYASAEYGDTGTATIRYLLLASITHPTGAVTSYDYGTSDTAVKALKLSVNDYGGYRQFFPVRLRRDTTQGRTFNTAEFSYVKSSNGRYIGTAHEKRPNGMSGEHSFNKKGQLLTKKTRHDERLFAQAEYTYGTSSTAADYKLMTREVARQYAAGSEDDYIEKTTEYTYSADKKADVIKVVERFSDDTLDREVNTTYGEYSIVTEQSRPKDAGTLVVERFELDADRESKVVAAKRVYEKHGGREVLREKAQYLYSADVQTNFCLTDEKHYCPTGDEALEDTENCVQLRYTYDSGQYTHAPVRTETLGVLDAEGNPAPVVYTVASYDVCGRVLTQTDANGDTTDYAYDPLGRVVAELYPEVDGVRHTKTNAYDDAANTITSTDENGERRRYRYTPLGQIEQVCVPAKDEPSQLDTLLAGYEYDELERVTAETAYGPDGAAKAVTAYTYDRLDRVLTKTIAAAGYEEQYVYTDVCADPENPDKKGFKTQKTVKGDATAPDVVSVGFTDQIGRGVWASAGGTVTGRMTYDLAGNKCSQTDALGHLTRWKYDHAGRQVATTLTDGGVELTSTTTYDALGRKAAATDYAGNRTTFRYDTAGRLLEQSSPFDHRRAVTRYWYDGNGSLTTQKVDQGTYWRETRYAYDARGRQVEVTLLADDTGACYSRSRYVYDGVGNKLEMHTGLDETGAEPAVVRYTYDGFGNVLTFEDALGQREWYAYDAVGVLQKKTDRNGSITEYAHDALDRLVGERVTSTDAKGTITSERRFEYAAGGQKKRETVTGVIDGTPLPELTTEYTYDERGRLAVQLDPDGVRKIFEYDPAGNRVRFTLTRNNAIEIDLHYAYDSRNRLAEVYKLEGETKTVLVVYGYDKNGNRVKLLYPQNGAETRYEYNAANLVTKLVNKRDTHLLSSWVYGYSPDGNQTSKRGRDDFITTYTYDQLGRLTEENDLKYSQIVYTYDRFSNRATMAVTPNGRQVDKPYVTTYTYDTNNRLLREEKREDGAVETLHYAYDQNGSQIRRERERVEEKRPTGKKGEIGFVTGSEQRGEATLDLRRYNGFGQLMQVTRDMVRTEYAYRPDGLRHGKTVTQTLHNKTLSTLHHWDGQSMVLETDGAVIKGRYLRGVNLICQVIDLSLAFYLFNAHGDVVQRVAHDGTRLAEYDYDAFGNQRGEPNVGIQTTVEMETDPNPFRYCGEYWDADIKEIYLRARTYNPQNGRFTSSDPAKNGLNWCTYCANNPIELTDPTGHAPVGITLDGTGPILWSNSSSYNDYLKQNNYGKGSSGNSNANIDVPPTSPSSTIESANLDLSSYGFSWVWPEFDHYINIGDFNAMDWLDLPAFAQLYYLGFMGSGEAYNFTGSTAFDTSFEQSNIMQGLIDETVVKFRQAGQPALQYSSHNFGDLYSPETSGDLDLLLSFGTLDYCWITCIQLPYGAVHVTVTIVDSYKFILQNESGVLNWINNKGGYAPQQRGELTPFPVLYSYSTIR